VLRGADPKLRSEYVVYTAHSDHMGIGKPVNGDAIYNGAGDNASGVAALLEIARAFRALPNPPARSVLFLAVTAEEMGLLGSDYFAHFPTVPIQSMVADVNMDEASISYAFKDIVARGAPDSTLGRVVERAASRLGLKVSPDPEPEQSHFIRSDQYSFVKQGIPSVFISEGYEAKDPKVDGKKVTGEWRATRYHKPSDDMSQPMDRRNRDLLEGRFGGPSAVCTSAELGLCYPSERTQGVTRSSAATILPGRLTGNGSSARGLEDLGLSSSGAFQRLGSFC